ISASCSLGREKLSWKIWIRKKAILIEWICSGEVKVTLVVEERFARFYNQYSTWDLPEFDEAANGFRYNLKRNFLVEAAPDMLATGQRYEACGLVSCFSPVRWKRENDRAWLTAQTEKNQVLCFVITFGEDIHQVLATRQEAMKFASDWAREQWQRYLDLVRSSPGLLARKAPVLMEIIRVTPLFLHSLLREKNPVEVAFRAANRGYGIWNGWDGQWACRVVNACQDFPTVRKYLNFLDACRGPNGAVAFALDYDFGPLYDINLHHPPLDRQLGAGWTVIHDCWALENLHEYFFQTGDLATLKRHYPKAAAVLQTIGANAGPEGLVESCFGGADYSHQVNRRQFPDPRDNRTISSRLTGVEDMGLLYHACQIGAELASLLGDQLTLRTCLELSGKVECSFRKYFFDEEGGFFLDAVWPKDKPAYRNRFFRLTSLLALSGYGELLVINDWETLANFVWNSLTHPVLGLREVPAEQPLPPGGLNRKENWLQNAARETLRLARLAGHARLLQLIVGKYQQHFQQEKVIRENLYNNQASEFFDTKKLYVSTSAWQAMTASAWWFGLLEAVGGLRLGRGQLEYLPGEGLGDVTVSNLRLAGRVWKVVVKGQGQWVSSIVVNGYPQCPGCYQLLPVGKSQWQTALIRKTDRRVSHPVLFSAGASQVKVIAC
ncbi:MAG TPA: hypothetical protein PKX93_09460, partial [bacterium]|nr:hypothetical protein [bacterium]